MTENTGAVIDKTGQRQERDPRCASVCPACDSTDIRHIRGKLHCYGCLRILETCCD